MSKKQSAREGWREKIEPGVYRKHRIACPSSRDHRPGRRCTCRLQVAAPGFEPGATRLVTLDEGATITKARNERRRLQAEGRSVSQWDADPGTVHEIAVAYFRARSPHLAPSTLRSTEDAYRLRVAPHLATKPVREITRPLVEAWLGTLLASGSSVHATRKALASLRVLLSFAVQAEQVERNVCFGVTVQEPPSDPDAPPAVERVLDAAELPLVVAACETPREEALVRLAAESGLRSGEVRGLRWPDCDLQARRVKVERSVWRNVVKRPKSKRSRRVAITHACAEALGRLYNEEVLGRGRDGRGYVFVGRDGASPVEPDLPLAVVQRVQVRASVTTDGNDGKPKAKATYHGLRHTSATHMLCDGVPLPVVARQLGHADSRITAGTYEHLQLLDDGVLDVALDVFTRPTSASKFVSDIAGDVAGDQSDEGATLRISHG
jgi:integrase